MLHLIGAKASYITPPTLLGNVLRDAEGQTQMTVNNASLAV